MLTRPAHLHTDEKSKRTSIHREVKPTFNLRRRRKYNRSSVALIITLKKTIKIIFKETLTGLKRHPLRARDIVALDFFETAMRQSRIAAFGPRRIVMNSLTRQLFRLAAALVLQVAWAGSVND